MYKSIGCRLNEQIFGFRKECVIKLGQKFVKYGIYIYTHTPIYKKQIFVYTKLSKFRSIRKLIYIYYDKT